MKYSLHVFTAYLRTYWTSGKNICFVDLTNLNEAKYVIPREIFPPKSVWMDESLVIAQCQMK